MHGREGGLEGGSADVVRGGRSRSVGLLCELGGRLYAT